MTTSTLQNKTILQPIALRESPTDKHPFEALKPVAHECRVEAERQADELRGALTSAIILMGRISTACTKMAASKTNSDRGPAVELLELVLSDLPQQLQQIQGLLESNLGAQAVPELRDLKRVCKNVVSLGSPGQGSQDLFRRGEAITTKYRDTEEAFDACGERILSRVPDLKFATAQVLVPRLLQVIDRTSQFSGGAAPLSWFRTECQSIIKRHDTKEDQKQVLNEISNILSKMEQLDGVLDRTSKELRDWSVTSSRRLHDTLSHLIDGRFLDIVEKFEFSVAEKLIPATTRALIAPHLDPISTSSAPIDTEKWLPQSVRDSVRGIGLDARGELVQIEPHGNIGKLVETLAAHLDQDDQGIFADRFSNRRLAPVLRAALLEARTVVAARNAQREQAAAERIRAEQETQRQVEENRAFVSMVFNELFDSSNGMVTHEREDLHQAFASQHPTPSSIQGRQEKLDQLAQDLSLPSNQLKENLEWYLLTDKQLERWAKDVDSLQQRLIEQLGSDAYLMIYDASNFLPSALPGIMKSYFPEK